MSSAYFASLVLLPVIITGPGTYRTYAGSTITITAASTRHDFGCLGTYRNGTMDGWHKSGRLYAMSSSLNDIVAKC